MPIVVDEVVISVDVSDSPSGAGGAAAGGARSSAAASPLEARQDLVAECVERVLEILAQRRER